MWFSVMLGKTWESSAAGLFDWVDRTFPPEDERAFVAPMRDIELLARISWERRCRASRRAKRPHIEDVPEESSTRLASDLPQLVAMRGLPAALRPRRVRVERESSALGTITRKFSARRGPWR